MSKLFKPWRKYLTSDQEEKTDSGITEWNLPVSARSKALTKKLKFMLTLLATKNSKREFKKTLSKDLDKKKSKIRKKEESLEWNKNNEEVINIIIKKSYDSKLLLFFTKHSDLMFIFIFVWIYRWK